MEENEHSQLKGPEKIFNRIIDKNLPNFKKEMAINVLEVYRTTNSLDQKRRLK